MESQYNGGDNAPTRYHKLPKPPLLGIICIFLESLAKWSHKIPQISQAIAIANAIGYLTQPDSKILLLKTIHTYAVEHEDVYLVLK